MKSSNIPVRGHAREVVREPDLSQLDLDEQAQRRAAEDRQAYEDRQFKRRVRKLIEASRQEAIDLMALKECGDEVLPLERIRRAAGFLHATAAELLRLTTPEPSRIERLKRKAS